jgi:hypothetical protein
MVRAVAFRPLSVHSSLAISRGSIAMSCHHDASLPLAFELAVVVAERYRELVADLMVLVWC